MPHDDPVEPEEERAHAKGLKLHLREVDVGACVFRIVTLRAATTARFSTNNFHDTWHILTDREGVFVLARLLWGLAFQRVPGTAVLIDGDHLVTTPFDGDPPDPILLLPAGLTTIDARLSGLLKRRLRQPGPGRTVRWRTFGLPRALAEREHPPRWDRSSKESVDKIGGFVCYSATRDLLRSQALSIYRMRDCKDMLWHYLDRDRHPNGEVQVFRDFRSKVSAAAVARHRVLGDKRAITTEGEREAVYREADAAAARLRAAHRRRAIA